MRSYNELLFRRSLAETIVKTLETDPALKEDPRQPEAIKKYKRQLATLENELSEHPDNPKPVVIGLQTARLTGESKIG